MSDRSKNRSLTGSIHELFPTVNVSATFRKREVVILYADNPMYPQYITLQFVQDRCELLDNYKKGQEVKIEFNLRGREWIAPDGTKKYFNTLEAWRISLAEQAPAAPAQSAAPVNTVPEDAVVIAGQGDLPF